MVSKYRTSAGALALSALIGSITGAGCSGSSPAGSGPSEVGSPDDDAAAASPEAGASGSGSSGSSSGGSGSGSSSSGGPILIHPGGSGAAPGGSSSGSGAAAGSSSSGATAAGANGIVGVACTTNAQCQTTDNPAVSLCSTMLTTNGSALYPTGVCLQGGCTPVSDDTTTHFCDGPDTAASPGVCVAIGTQGDSICTPKCLFSSNGSAPIGCLGKTACNTTGAFIADPTGTTIAGDIGFCFGGCSVDADCPAGNKCATGLCMAGAVTPPSKAAGAKCTEADVTSGACNCILNAAGTSGVCAPPCVTGPGAVCPTGFECDSFLQTVYTIDDGGTITGFATQNPGLAGFCFQDCGGGDGGKAGACPATLTCYTTETVGADCLPF
jgi:hypothetical protein